MRYIKKPKYKLDRTKLNVSTQKNVTAEDIYKEMLMEKIKKRKR